MPEIRNFAFTDQLIDTVIDLTEYIEKYSTDRFDMKFHNDQPVVATVKNLFQYTDIISDFKDKGSAFVLYQLKDGDLPEDVSKTYYGTYDFWWAILLFNSIDKPLHQWILSERQVHHLVDLYHRFQNKYSKEGYYTLLSDTNESRRSIDVLKKEHLLEFISELKKKVITEQITEFTISL